VTLSGTPAFAQSGVTTVTVKADLDNAFVLLAAVLVIFMQAESALLEAGLNERRPRFKAAFVYSLVIAAVIYPMVVHWFWGGGWLAQLGTPFIDFAGSTIVHATGGVAGLRVRSRSAPAPRRGGVKWPRVGCQLQRRRGDLR
jgi:ammonia channel protein AmtB